jgi:hypothetical protein
MMTDVPSAQSERQVEYRVLVCGSRDWRDRRIIHEVLRALADCYPDLRIVVVHGAARGADRMAGEEARACGYKVEEHPADWKRHGRRAGVIRNAHMLSLGCSRVVAFWDGKSRGTERTWIQQEARANSRPGWPRTPIGTSSRTPSAPSTNCQPTARRR